MNTLSKNGHGHGYFIYIICPRLVQITSHHPLPLCELNMWVQIRNSILFRCEEFTSLCAPSLVNCYEFVGHLKKKDPWIRHSQRTGYINRFRFH